MARKSATSRVTTNTHATCARMSLEPDKRVCASLETTSTLALFPSISGRFMLLSLTQERRKTQRLREVSLFLSHIISHLHLESVTSRNSFLSPISTFRHAEK